MSFCTLRSLVEFVADSLNSSSASPLLTCSRFFTLYLLSFVLSISDPSIWSSKGDSKLKSSKPLLWSEVYSSSGTKENSSIGFLLAGYDVFVDFPDFYYCPLESDFGCFCGILGCCYLLWAYKTPWDSICDLSNDCLSCLTRKDGRRGGIAACFLGLRCLLGKIEGAAAKFEIEDLSSILNVSIYLYVPKLSLIVKVSKVWAL